MNKTRLTPLGRLVMLIMAFSVGAASVAAGAAATRPHAAEWRCVTVRAGDTLWGLALESSDADPREAVHRVVRHNRLQGAGISPGMAIWVPNDRDGRLLGADDASCPGGR